MYNKNDPIKKQFLSFRPGHYGTIGRAIPAPVVPKPGMQVIFTPLVLNFE